MIDLATLDFDHLERSAEYVGEPEAVSEAYIQYLEASLRELDEDETVLREFYEHRLFMAQHGHTLASAQALML